MSCLKTSHRMGPSQYIFPQDDRVEGSSTLYKALYKRCLERDLFILVRYTLRKNTMPKMAALVPQRGEEQPEAESFVVSFLVMYVWVRFGKKRLRFG